MSLSLVLSQFVLVTMGQTLSPTRTDATSVTSPLFQTGSTGDAVRRSPTGTNMTMTASSSVEKSPFSSGVSNATLFRPPDVYPTVAASTVMSSSSSADPAGEEKGIAGRTGANEEDVEIGQPPLPPQFMTQCAMSEHTCDNGRCIPMNKYCDNVNDCGDSSDEPRYCTSELI